MTHLIFISSCPSISLPLIFPSTSTPTLRGAISLQTLRHHMPQRLLPVAMKGQRQHLSRPSDSTSLDTPLLQKTPPNFSVQWTTIWLDHAEESSPNLVHHVEYVFTSFSCNDAHKATPVIAQRNWFAVFTPTNCNTNAARASPHIAGRMEKEGTAKHIRPDLVAHPFPTSQDPRRRSRWEMSSGRPLQPVCRSPLNGC